MSKLFVRFMVLTAVSALNAGFALAQGNSVASNAYLYTGEDAQKPVIVIEQPGTVRFVNCQLDAGEALPNTPEKLTSLLSSSKCTRASSTSSQEGQEEKVVLVHQKKSDRYILVQTVSIMQSAIEDWMPLPSAGLLVSGQGVITFDVRAKNTLNAMASMVVYLDGENPTLESKRESLLKQYEAVIQYPAIAEKPIKQ